MKNSEIIMEKSFPFEYNNIEKEGFFHDVRLAAHVSSGLKSRIHPVVGRI